MRRRYSDNGTLITHRGAKSSPSRKDKAEKGSNSSKGDKSHGAADRDADKNIKEGEKRKPVCLYPQNQEKDLHHYLKDCRQLLDPDKERLWAEYKQRRRENSLDHVRRAHNCVERSNPRGCSGIENKEAHSTVLFAPSLAGCCLRDTVRRFWSGRFPHRNNNAHDRTSRWRVCHHPARSVPALVQLLRTTRKAPQRP